MSPRVIAWFRNDLRLLDNAALRRAAAAAAAGGGEVWPVFCLDAARLAPNASAEPDGARDADAHRVRFLLQSLAGLRKRLQKLGSDLLVVQAAAHDVLPAILLAAQPSDSPALVVAQEEPAWPEAEAQSRVAAALAQASLGELELVSGTTCFHRNDLGFASDLSDLPDSRGSFGVLAERAAHVHFPLPAPDQGSLGQWSSLGSISDALTAQGWQVGIPDEATVLGVAADRTTDPLAVMDFIGGEEAGLARVEEYVWDNEENLEVGGSEAARELERGRGGRERTLVSATYLQRHARARAHACSHAQVYFETRNGFLGRDFSSKFSPWLALGCLSPRWCYWEVVRWERGEEWYKTAENERRQGVAPGGKLSKEQSLCAWKYDEWSTAPPPARAGTWPSRETGFGEGKGSYWMVFEFESRDFMHLMAHKHGASLFSIPAAAESSIDADTLDRFRRWRDGCTGIPLVDACMRELARTGYLSNRGRMIVANFLCSDLCVPYWLGARHFENVCIDHDAAINWGYFKGCARSFGHWAVASQTFGGIRSQQPFAEGGGEGGGGGGEGSKAEGAANVEVGGGGLGRGGSDLLRQCYLYDCDGTYIRTWVAELEKLPAPWCFAPWELPSDSSDGAMSAGKYPAPCVPVAWSVAGSGPATGANPPDCAPFHSFSPDRVMSGAQRGSLRFLDFDQAKIGGNLDLARVDDERQVIGEVQVRISRISEGVTYGAGGLAVGLTARDDLLPLTGGRCLGMAWGVCDNTLNFPRQQAAKCVCANQADSADAGHVARRTWSPFAAAIVV